MCDVSHCFQGVVGNARDINYNNLTKESPNVNKFTRFFCVSAMATIVAEAHGQSRESAVRELDNVLGETVDPLNVGVIPNPTQEVRDRMSIAETACRMVHTPQCLFWQTEWGEVPVDVGCINWGQANPARRPPVYGRGRGRGRARLI